MLKSGVGQGDGWQKRGQAFAVASSERRSSPVSFEDQLGDRAAAMMDHGAEDAARPLRPEDLGIEVEPFPFSRSVNVRVDHGADVPEPVDGTVVRADLGRNALQIYCLTALNTFA